MENDPHAQDTLFGSQVRKKYKVHYTLHAVEALQKSTPLEMVCEY